MEQSVAVEAAVVGVLPKEENVSPFVRADEAAVKRRRLSGSDVNGTAVGVVGDSELERTRAAMAKLDAELDEFRRHHEVLLHKYETVGNEITKLLQQKGDLEIKAKMADKRAERHELENVRLREQVDKLKEKVKETEVSAKTGPADAAEAYEAKARVGELEDENKKLRDKLQARNSDTDYMRAEYQKASSAAAEAHRELAELKTANAELQRRADGEATRLRAMQFDSERTARDDKIRELRLRVDILEDQVRKMDAEKQQMRGRYGVRSTSVPRRTMSPAVAVSRGGSPSLSTNGAHPLQTVHKLE
ncbi:uncharacterized protein V1510DRAFT_308267 [Dipodascopsis tothii]|uniref:uncharacterized protein n=1 Tax=Dipodascopsis tothii TaxID=44089 RepID=UPI0034CD992A